MPRNHETAQNMAAKIMSVVTAQNKKTNTWVDTLCETIHAWVVLSFLYAGAYPTQTHLPMTTAATNLRSWFDYPKNYIDL